jgi:hypothetical protein
MKLNEHSDSDGNIVYTATLTSHRQWREYDALSEDEKATYDMAIEFGADHLDAMFAAKVLS